MKKFGIGLLIVGLLVAGLYVLRAPISLMVAKRVAAQRLARALSLV